MPCHQALHMKQTEVSQASRDAYAELLLLLLLPISSSQLALFTGVTVLIVVEYRYPLVSSFSQSVLFCSCSRHWDCADF